MLPLIVILYYLTQYIDALQIQHSIKVQEGVILQEPIFNIIQYVNENLAKRDNSNPHLSILDSSSLNPDHSKKLGIKINYNGDIAIEKAIDRESLCSDSFEEECPISLHIILKDLQNSHNIINFSLIIYIIDVNDCRPEFKKNLEIFRLSEQALINEVISLPIAKDKDSLKNNYLIYSIEEVNNDNFKQYFSLEFVSGPGEYCYLGKFLKREEVFFNQTVSPCLLVKKQLDYESQKEFNAQLIAKDRDGLNGSISIRIIVENINDNAPIWPERLKTAKSESVQRNSLVSENTQTSYFYEFGVWENLRNNPLVLLEAIDPDQVNNERESIKFSIGENSKFSKRLFIKNNILHINHLGFSNLDSEIEKVIIIAEDGGGLRTPAEFIFKIKDLNDNAPEISVRMLNFSLFENEKYPKTILITISVIDKDRIGSKNSEFDCSLEDSGDKIIIEEGNCFLGNNTTCKIYNIFLKPDEIFDYETQKFYSFAIKCADQGDPIRFSVENVKIPILDVNDNPPVFVSQRNFFLFKHNENLKLSEIETVKNYSFEISESAQVGTLIGQLFTVDMDSADNSETIYEIEKTLDDSWILPFTLTEKAEIKVISQLDRETKDTYSFYVVAKDRNNSMLSNRVSVNIQLTDINDCKPILTSSKNYEIVESYENEILRHEVCELTGEDEDLGLNGTVKFRLKEPNSIFSIKDGNILYVHGRLDREVHPVIQLEIILEDEGHPVRLSSTETITLQVLDRNDNAPKFISKSDSSQGSSSKYKYLSISLDTPTETEITRVYAEDPDLLENGTVIFSFNGDFHNEKVVDINSYKRFYSIHENGQIFLSQKLIPSSSSAFHRIRSLDKLEIIASDLSITPKRSKTVIYIQYFDPSQDSTYKGTQDDLKNDKRSILSFHRILGNKTFPILCGIAISIFLFFIIIILFMLYAHIRQNKINSMKHQLPINNNINSQDNPEVEIMNNYIGSHMMLQDTGREEYLTLTNFKNVQNHGNDSMTFAPMRKFDNIPGWEQNHQFLDQRENNCNYYKVLVRNEGIPPAGSLKCLSSNSSQTQKKKVALR